MNEQGLETMCCQLAEAVGWLSFKGFSRHGGADRIFFRDGRCFLVEFKTLTGKVRQNQKVEAEAMKNYLVGKGIPEDQILLEDKSTTTVENLKFSSRFLNRREDSVGIVTNNFHMFRSLKLARKNGYRNCEGIAAGSTPLYLPNNILRECLGIVKEVVCGNF